MTRNHECREFRNRLARALEGLPMPAELTTLSWHGHLLECGLCRELLEREKALEMLLASWPEPNLPPELRRRLVACLANHNDSAPVDATAVLETVGSGPSTGRALGLDDLLDIAGAPVPEGLGARVREGLRAELALDALLDLDDHVALPATLTADVLRGLAGDRERSLPRLRLLRSVPTYAAAAAVLLAVLGLTWWDGAFDGAPAERAGEKLASANIESLPAAGSLEPDASLLAVLDIIENDGLWTDTQEGAEIVTDEGDLYLLLSDSIEPGDELLLAYLDEVDLAGEDSEPADPSDG